MDMFSLLIVLVNSGNDVWLKTKMADHRHDWTLEDDLVLVTARDRFQQLRGIYRRIIEHPDYSGRFGQLSESALRSRYSKLFLAGLVPGLLEQAHLGEEEGQQEGHLGHGEGEDHLGNGGHLGNGEGQQEGHLGHGEEEGHLGNGDGNQGGFDLAYDFYEEDPLVLVNNEGVDDEVIHFEDGLNVIDGLPDAGGFDDGNWADMYNVVNEEGVDVQVVNENNEGGDVDQNNAVAVEDNNGNNVNPEAVNNEDDPEAVNNEDIAVGNENNAIADEDGIEVNNIVTNENNTVAGAAVGPVGPVGALSGPGAADSVDEDST